MTPSVCASAHRSFRLVPQTEYGHLGAVQLRDHSQALHHEAQWCAACFGWAGGPGIQAIRMIVLERAQCSLQLSHMGMQVFEVDQVYGRTGWPSVPRHLFRLSRPLHAWGCYERKCFSGREGGAGNLHIDIYMLAHLYTYRYLYVYRIHAHVHIHMHMHLHKHMYA